MPRANNVAGGLTRPLNGPEFRKFVNLLGIKGEGEGNGDSRVNVETMGMPAGESYSGGRGEDLAICYN